MQHATKAPDRLSFAVALNARETTPGIRVNPFNRYANVLSAFRLARRHALEGRTGVAVFAMLAGALW